jgi:hypothetical protein
LHPLFPGLKQRLEAENDDIVGTAVTRLLEEQDTVFF